MCFSAVEAFAAPPIPAALAMNRDAREAGLVVVTLRLENGEELPFFVDTGSSATVFDKSWTPRLGKPVGKVTLGHWGNKGKADLYRMPGLYAGSTRLLVSGGKTIVYDLKELSDRVRRPIVGVLGMDVLKYYCVQLDFAAGQMRFLDGRTTDSRAWGKAFRIVTLTTNDARPAIAENLAGVKGPHALIDSGDNSDGWLRLRYFQPWTNATASGAEKVYSPDGRLGGETYPQLRLRAEEVESDGIGLRFLARHLVTMDFPNKTLYLKKITPGGAP